MPITPLPTPPSRADSVNFSARSDALFTALPTLVSEMNALELNTNAQTAANEAASQAAALAAGVARDRAIAAWSAATVPDEQLASFAPSLHIGAIVKAIIYDTSKDSDGGAWRKRMQDKSWYNETLGGSTWLGQQPSEAVARGSFGSTESPNLVTNGTFTTDTSGWTIAGSATFVQSGGSGLLTNGAATSGYVYQALSTVVGRTYVVTGTITRGTSINPRVGVDNAVNAAGLAIYQAIADGPFAITFVATATATFINLLQNDSTSGRTTTFDNISVKLADSAIDTSNLLYQSTADGKFYKTVSTSGTTEVFRGISREFPAMVAIVAESARVVIYDMTVSSCPMWRSVSTAGVIGYGSAATFIAASHGVLLIGMTNGLFRFDFLRDFIGFKQGVNDRVQNLISSSSTQALVSASPQTFIANNTVNDVAITVLDSAPIDPATGLPVPTIAVATSGGVSVIKDDGTVVNLTAGFGSVPQYSVDFNDRKQLLTQGYWPEDVAVFNVGASNFSGNSAAYTYASIPAIKSAPGQTSRTIQAGKSLAVRNNLALTLLRENPATFAKGMVAYITNAYNSGWLPGDIRGAYLSDSVAETITGSGELVLTRDFATDTNWTKTGTASISGGVANIPADNSGIYQSVATVVGRTYVYTATVVTANASLVFYVGLNGTGSQMLDSGGVTTTGAKVYTFVAQSNTSFIRVHNFATGGVTAIIDNISVKLAEPDRSVKNNGLVLNGTLTKAAVASGAGLVAYSGFSASNYLEQPYSANLDFGTGDFCVMGWIFLPIATGNDCLFRRKDPASGTNWFGVTTVAGVLNWQNGTNTPVGYTMFGSTWTHVCFIRVAGVVRCYVNGIATSLALSDSTNYTNALATFVVGGEQARASWLTGSMALWRISATAPSADQIAHIYRTELPLFQAGAQCAIAGTSTAVTALAYDDVADELHVGTSWGRSEFKDLLRVASEATTTGAITSLSANEGVILTGGTSGKVYAPAMYLRDELRRKDQARRALGRVPAFFDYTATASQTAFVAPKGFTVKALYKNGTLMREATTGVFWTRSNDGFQETATLSVGATVSDWVSIMCVRV